MAREKVKKWINVWRKNEHDHLTLRHPGLQNESQCKDNRCCLCHGKAGAYVINSILKEDEKAEQYLSDILAVAGQISSDQDDFSGIYESDNYGLFTGLSGIAYVLTTNINEMEMLLTGWVK